VVDERRRYEAKGAREDWLVDPEVEAATLLRRGDDGRFAKAADLSLVEGGGTLETPLLPGFALDLATLFAD